MSNKVFSVITAIILVLAIICTVICGWQTGNLRSCQDVFAAEHPDYIPHSWYLLMLATVVAALAGAQLILRNKISALPTGAVSALMAVLEVLTIRAAVDQHYNAGIVISDYGIQFPFESGWLLLGLMAVLILGTAAQLLAVIVSALNGKGQNR